MTPVARKSARRHTACVQVLMTMLTQGDGLALTGRTCCVRCASHYRMLRTSSISFLIVQPTVTLEPSTQVFFSKSALYRISWLSVNQIHVEFFLQTVFLMRKCLLHEQDSVCWPPVGPGTNWGPQDNVIKHIQVQTCTRWVLTSDEALLGGALSN